MVIRTPDRRLRVFISSTLQELASERRAASEAVGRLRLTPVMFEQGARPHPPRKLYRAYLDQSDVFVGIYWQSYGWVAPGEAISGLEDEYRLAGARPRLIYIKSPAPDRDPRLGALLERVRGDDHASYRGFESAAELRELIENDLAVLLTERFEIATGGEPGALPGGPATNVPVPRNRLIGRERELAAACGLLRRDDVSLVTLVGSGGSGKSRLGLQVALDLLGDFEDGAFLVALESVRDPDLVMSTIAHTIPIPALGDPAGSPTVDLLGYLRNKRMLLLLDNFEQVIEAAPIVSALLEACPRVKVLVTSRAPLRVRAEKELPVPPLSLPAPRSGLDAERLSAYSAVQLFIERAKGVKPDFIVTNETAPAVAEICDRLDGLPLAIELAAARVKILPPPALLSRLERRLDVLRGGTRDLPERQHTMRAAIGWSYDLLDDGARTVFRRLAVFPSSWSLDAAEAVCAAPDDPPVDILEAMDVLLGNSLLTPPATEDGLLRFRMLETIREFGRERLAESGEIGTVRRRHAEFYLKFAERFAQLGAERPLVRDDHSAIEVEIDNVRAARAWLRAQGRAVDELRLLSALRIFFSVRGYQVEAREALTDALVRGAEAPPEVRAGAVTACIWLAYRAGDYAAAKAWSEELLALSDDLPDPLVKARALGELGGVAASEADYATARALYEQSAELFRGIGAIAQLAAVLGNLGDVALNQGQLDRAEQLFVESVALAREAVNADEESASLFTLARTRLVRGDPDAARTTLLDALRVATELGYPEVLAYCVTLAAELATPLAPESAAELAGAGEAAFERLGIPMQRLEREAHERTLASLRVRLGPRLDELRESGRALDLDQGAIRVRSLLEAAVIPSVSGSTRTPPGPHPTGQGRPGTR